MNRKEFIEKNIPLVHSCCKRFLNRGVEYEDLFQTGCIGLIKAVDGFDESLGYKFSTYAVPVILGELKRIFRDGGIIKVSRSVKELNYKVIKATDTLREKNKREPKLSEISNLLAVPVSSILEAIDASAPVMSLTVENNDNTNNQLEVNDNSFEEVSFNKICLKEEIEKLSDFDRNIVVLRYYKSKTQKETAEYMGTTQVNISRREKVILNQLRKKLA